MGRNTHELIGKALPNRTNIVVTRKEHLINDTAIDFYADTQLIFTRSIEETLFFADIISICHQSKEIFVIGGQAMYESFGRLVNKVYLTEVIADVSGDAFFNMQFPPKVWRTVDENYVAKLEGDDYGYKFTVFQKRDRKSRYKFVREFLTDLEQKKNWIRNNLDDVKRKVSEYAVENMEFEL